MVQLSLAPEDMGRLALREQLVLTSLGAGAGTGLDNVRSRLALAFGDTSGGFRKLIQIVFGLSIAFAASSFFLSFFSFGGGALV